MIRYRAAWVLPICRPPVRDGWVAVERGRIACAETGLDSARAAGRGTDDRRVDLGDVVVLPGLVNAHTHLELSWLRGRIPSVDSFPEWIGHVMGARREMPDPSDPRILEAVSSSLDEAVRAGTAAIGDISNTSVSFRALMRWSGLAVLFRELIDFKAEDAERAVRSARDELDRLGASDRLRTSLAAHAPYSVAPALFRAIADDLDRHSPGASSVHLAESRDEIEFLRTGAGKWRELLEQAGSWNPRWVPPHCGPVAYLRRLGFLDRRILIVHGVQLTPSELSELAAHGVTLVTCPRSNIATGAGVPPVASFYASGVNVAVGTDSLASVPDLNMFSELEMLRRLAPAVPASALLESATRGGARALGFDAESGTIEPGKRAALLAVDLPSGVPDVEEYLVNGVRPDRIRWVHELRHR